MAAMARPGNPSTGNRQVQSHSHTPHLQVSDQSPRVLYLRTPLTLVHDEGASLADQEHYGAVKQALVEWADSCAMLSQTPSVSGSGEPPLHKEPFIPAVQRAKVET
jgi:hypothetical protein